jgi:2-dehydropantoate 2-reductase
MRVVVYGAGAIGGVIGGRLAQHGNDVVLIARGAHYEAMRDRGLQLVDPDGEISLRVPVVDHPSRVDWRADDVAVLAMKTQDTSDAVGALAASSTGDIAVVCAQNGVENERIAARRFARVYAMCVMLPSTHLEPGVVEASSGPISGLLDLGVYPHGVDGACHEIARVLSESTFESVPRADIMRWKYTKLLMNLGNAVEALCRRDGNATELARRARREGARVLRAAGIDLASQEEDRDRRGDRLQPRPIHGSLRGGGSSWQSLQRGAGAIETDYLNGEIVLLGRLHGVATPVNALLQRLANDAVRSGSAPGARRAGDLLGMLAAD